MTPAVHVRALACLYAASLPFDLFSVLLGVSPTVPLGLLLTLAWALDARGSGRAVLLPRGSILVSFVLFVGWAIATWLWSVNLAVSVVTTASLAWQLVLMGVLADVVRFSLRAVLASLASANAALGLLLLASPLRVDRGQAGSLGDADENATAFVLSIGFAAAIYLVMSTQSLVLRFLWLGEAAVVAAGVLHTGSRTGFLALAGVLLVALATSFRSRHALRAAGVGCGAIVTYQWLVASGRVPERVLSSVSDAIARNDSGRAEIISMYRHSMSEWYLIGVGYGADSYHLLRSVSQFKNAHSLFWKTWIEMGIPGLVLLGVLVAFLVREATRSRARAVTALMAAPVGLFAITLGEQTSNTLWFVAALALARGPITALATRTWRRRSRFEAIRPDTVSEHRTT